MLQRGPFIVGGITDTDRRTLFGGNAMLLYPKYNSVGRKYLKELEPR